MLLFEITAFLRDSYRRLPHSNRVSMRSDRTVVNAGSLNVATAAERPTNANLSAGAEAHAPAAGLATLAAGSSVGTAGRRWSVALSLMGQSQTSAQSLQSIAGDGHSNGNFNTIKLL